MDNGTPNQMTNKFGFPIQTCTRCNGTGHHLFNFGDGTICYGCRGKGTQVTKNAKAAWSAFLAARHAQRETTGADLQVGDMIVMRANDKNIVGTIVSIVVTDEECGWYISDGQRVADAYKLEVTISAGAFGLITGSIKQNQYVKRQSKPVDPQPYLDMIK